MVKLTKIYTRTGDGGRTGLGDGSRVSKSHRRVEACGAVDEANAAIGLAAASCATVVDDKLSAIRRSLASIQNDLFDVGADLCTPIAESEKPGDRLRMTQTSVDRLEACIDEHNAALPALSSFVLPGGCELAARLHLARTAVRRAERASIVLQEQEETRTNPLAVVYLNRLSDLLFVLARQASRLCGDGDILWSPGAEDDKSQGD